MRTFILLPLIAVLGGCDTNPPDRIEPHGEKPAEVPAKKKLSEQEAGELMALDIGRWTVKGKGMPAGGDTYPIEMTMDVTWKEKNKSLHYSFTLFENGEEVTYQGQKHYDLEKGLFVYRSKWGDAPESVSHEVYDPCGHSYTAESSTGEPGSPQSQSTTVTKRVMSGQMVQKFTQFKDGNPVLSHEMINTRVGDPRDKTIDPGILRYAKAVEVDDEGMGITGFSFRASVSELEAAGSLVVPQKYQDKPVVLIAADAFNSKSYLSSVTTGDRVSAIGSWAFFGCRNLTDVIVGDAVTVIHDTAFFSCRKLTRVTLGGSLVRIGGSAFEQCERLPCITIPASVKRIGKGAFARCSRLTSVTFLGDAPKVEEFAFPGGVTIYRKPEAKGWGQTYAGRPVKLIIEKS